MPQLIRRAVDADLDAIVGLLADDVLGAAREQTGPDGLSGYLQAFRQIQDNPSQVLAVVEDAGRIVGTCQLTFIPGLARGGLTRCQVEAVRVASDRRGEKIGEAMFGWVFQLCRARQCGLVQLTTDKRRRAAHRFYEKLGFEPSHVGYKLML